LPLLSCDTPWPLPPLSDTREGLDDEFSPGLIPIKQASPVTQCSNKKTSQYHIRTHNSYSIPYNSIPSKVVPVLN
jgi:hypothetical protein